MIQDLDKKTLYDWYISYNPYTDFFQIYDDKALRIDRGHLKKRTHKDAQIYIDTNNTPLLVEFSDTFDKLGDIDNLDKTSIIDRVTGYLSTMEKEEPKVNLSIVSPVLNCDGNAMGINEDGSVNLIFFQATNKSDDSIDARTVSIVRLTREQLEVLGKTIQDTIEHINKNPSKKK